jgi:ABC-type transport system involved in cytochrome c biogenesis permease component
MLRKIIKRNGLLRTVLVLPLRGPLMIPLFILTQIGEKAEEMLLWLDGVLPGLQAPDE